MKTLVLLCAMAVSSCAHQLTAGCAWGAGDATGAGACAIQNFGQDGYKFLLERDARCGGCRGLRFVELGDDFAFCAVSCRRR